MIVIANRLILSGIVCLLPARKISPSGIPHCQFVLEHRSQQIEAGFNRQAWCRIPVVVSGQSLQPLTEKLTGGSQISVQGFVSCHQGHNRLSKLVLHAEQIEFIDFGG